MAAGTGIWIVVALLAAMAGAKAGLMLGERKRHVAFDAMRGHADFISRELQQRIRENQWLLRQLVKGNAREDDSQPLTTDWLIQMGWRFDAVDDDLLDMPHTPQLSCQFSLGVNDFELFIDGEDVGRVLQTRGDVRLLCKAMGIPLHNDKVLPDCGD